MKKSVIPQVINKFNMYKNSSQLVGVTGEVELPAVTMLTDTLEGAGTGGNLEIPVIGLTENMEMNVPFLSLCEGIFSLADPTEAVDLALRGAIQGMDSATGKIQYIQMAVMVRGIIKEFTPGTVKAGGKMSSSVTLSLNYYKIVMDRKTMLEIDKLNGVYEVNGKDVLAEVRNMC